MQQTLLLLALVLAASQTLFTHAKPIPGNTPSRGSASRVFLGWRGIRSQKDPSGTPYVSGGGELGAVLYIADGTDLARLFATSAGWVCAVDADAQAWSTKSKAWVSQYDITTHKDKATLYPGSVLFASHTAAGMGPGDDQSPWQMGVRADDIARLGLKTRCYKFSDVAGVPPHHKLNYPTLKDWNIQGKPQRGA